MPRRGLPRDARPGSGACNGPPLPRVRRRFAAGAAPPSPGPNRSWQAPALTGTPPSLLPPEPCRCSEGFSARERNLGARRSGDRLTEHKPGGDYGGAMIGFRSSRAASAARWAIAAVLALLLTPSAGWTDQFVLFDVTFSFSKMDADTSTPSKSHYYVKGAALNPQRPRDWTSPVDYRNGTVHIRLEVLDRPASGEPTQWSLCYIPNRGQGNGYGCTGTPLYAEKGVYEKDVSMKSFWQNDAILWTEGIK